MKLGLEMNMATPILGVATSPKGAAMKSFLEKHADSITGTLSCFDRMIFKGYLPVNRPDTLQKYLSYKGILRKDFGKVAKGLSDRIAQHAKAVAEHNGRPYNYFRKLPDKEGFAREIMKRDRISKGLVCVIGIQERCRSFKVVKFKNGQFGFTPATRQCNYYYYYFVDPEFGLMHVRIQSWLPFTIQVYINGHEWLARKLDRHAIEYRRLDNCFAWVADPVRAQKFSDKLAKKRWVRILEMFARRVNPLFRTFLKDMDHYWVTDQCEYATDVMFMDRASLQRLYPHLVKHATLSFTAEDVLTFLGRKLHGCFKGEVLNDYKKRIPGARVKHRMKENWIKMYDKYGVVLRIETVINHPYEFRVRRRGVRQGREVLGWFPMAKRVSNLHRYAEVSLSANRHYLEALSSVDDPTEANRLLESACRPAKYRGNKRRPLRIMAPEDTKLFRAVLRGEHLIHGFRNRDLARHLCSSNLKDPDDRRRASARITRWIQLLRAHSLIRKIPRSRRYRLTLRGAILMSACIRVRDEAFPSIMLQSSA
jgi:hypothetical protein